MWNWYEDKKRLIKQSKEYIHRFTHIWSIDSDKHAKSIHGEIIVFQANYAETTGYPYGKWWTSNLFSNKSLKWSENGL